MDLPEEMIEACNKSVRETLVNLHGDDAVHQVSEDIQACTSVVNDMIDLAKEWMNKGLSQASMFHIVGQGLSSFGSNAQLILIAYIINQATEQIIGEEIDGL